MSYILDALKKIELEKTKKVRPDGSISISGDLFHERKQPTARAGTWKVIGLIVVASLVTCAGTWFVLQKNGKKSAAIIRPAPLPPKAYAPAIPQIATPAIPVPVQPQPRPVAVPPAVPSSSMLVTKRRAAVTVANDKPSVRVRRSQNRNTVEPSPPKPPVQSVQAPADIKLSGIAWQDERTGRRAVINGFLLKEGAVVSGAKITDIQSDKVRFSSPAGLFEVKLDSVVPTEVKP